VVLREILQDSQKRLMVFTQLALGVREQLHVDLLRLRGKVAFVYFNDTLGVHRVVLAAGRYDGIACLGAVIRGETDHYDWVCAEAARGIQDVQLRTGVPCAFGVLTVDTMEQALARSGGDKRDSGRHAAEAVVALARLRRQLG